MAEELNERKEFHKFIKELENTFDKRLFSSKQLQERYCLLPSSNKDHLNPDELLEYIKEALDKFFPGSDFDEKLIDNNKIIAGKSKFPIRVLA
jgi:hypothetical protein